MHLISFQAGPAGYTQWRTQKISEGGKFSHNRVTSQINFKGSAEGTTILGRSGDKAPGKFCKITPKIRIFMRSGSKF